MIEAGLIFFVSVMAVLVKMPRGTAQKLLGYEYQIDIIASLIFVMSMYGTYSGMMTAAVSALALSIAMAIMKRIIGFQKWHRRHGWELYTPKWRDRHAEMPYE